MIPLSKLYSFLFVSAALYSQAPTPLPPTPPATGANTPESVKTSFKGVEVYSWQDKDSWRFAILPGTNFVKTEAIVLEECKQGMSLAEFKREFAKLPKGEFVIWVTTDTKMKIPPQSITADIELLAKSLDIKWVQSHH